MLKYLLVGVLVFIGVAVAFLPATLVQRALENVPNASLIAPRGTLWGGSGELMLLDPQQAQHSFGPMTWNFRTLSLLSFTPTYDVTLQELELEVSYGFTGTSVNITGEMALRSLQPWLDLHQMVIGGRLSTKSLDVQLDPAQPWATLHAAGLVHWTGGPVSYFIAQNQSHAILPPLKLHLSTTEEAQWRLHGDVMGEEKFPLLTLALNAAGYVKVSVTKRLTQLVGSPWPGSDPDHVNVLEVEQPLF